MELPAIDSACSKAKKKKCFISVMRVCYGATAAEPMEKESVSYPFLGRNRVCEALRLKKTVDESNDRVKSERFNTCIGQSSFALTHAAKSQSGQCTHTPACWPPCCASPPPGCPARGCSEPRGHQKMHLKGATTKR